MQNTKQNRLRFSPVPEPQLFKSAKNFFDIQIAAIKAVQLISTIYDARL